MREVAYVSYRRQGAQDARATHLQVTDQFVVQSLRDLRTSEASPSRQFRPAIETLSEQTLNDMAIRHVLSREWQ